MTFFPSLFVVILGLEVLSTTAMLPPTPHLQELFTLDCNGVLHVASGTILASSIDLGTLLRPLDAFTRQVKDRVDCKCAKTPIGHGAFRRRFAPFEALLFGLTQPRSETVECLDSPNSAVRDLDKVVRTFINTQVQVPPTCTLEGYYNGTAEAGCYLRYHPIPGRDMRVDVAMATCPDSYNPFLSATCSGAFCNMLQPCAADADCPANNMQCADAFTYFETGPQQIIDTLTSIFVYAMGTTNENLNGCMTPDKMFSKMLGALSDIFPFFPSQYSTTKLCVPKEPFVNLMKAAENALQGATEGVLQMTEWDGKLPDGSLVVNPLRRDGKIFPQSQVDAAKPGEWRVAKFGCDSLLHAGHNKVQIHHLGRVLSSFGDTVSEVWKCQLEPGKDANHIKDNWSGDFTWFMEQFVPRMKLEMMPWESLTWLWGLTTNGSAPLKTKPSTNPSWVRALFDPAFSWFAATPAKTNRTTFAGGSPLPTDSQPDWALHPQTPGPVIEGEIFALTLPCVGGKNASLMGSNPSCQCSTVIQQFGSTCVARFTSCNATAGRYTVCIDGKKQPGVLAVLPRNNSAVMNPALDRLKLPSTCTVDGYRSDGVCGVSLSGLAPHATLNVRVTSCETLSFGHDSVEIICKGPGCQELAMDHVCALDNDCTDGYTCVDYGDILLDIVTGLIPPGMLPIPSSAIRNLLRNHDLLGAILFGGIKNTTNMKDFDVQGFLGSLMGTMTACAGTGFHVKDVIAFYNSVTKQAFSMEETQPPKVCYSATPYAFYDMITKARTTQLSTMTADEANCADSSKCPLLWSIPGVGPHNPWRTRPTLQIIFPRAIQTDPLLILDRVANALDISRSNIELLEEDGQKIDFSFTGMSDSGDLIKGLIARDNTWWVNTLGLSDATGIKIICTDTCPSGVNSASANASPSSSSTNINDHHKNVAIAVSVVGALVVLIAGVGCLIKGRVAGGMAGWAPVPTQWKDHAVGGTEMGADDGFENAVVDLDED